MRITVDWDLCQGHGVCMDEAPEVFAVEARTGGYPRVVLLQEEPSQDLRRQVEQAVKHCPTRALRIVGE